MSKQTTSNVRKTSQELDFFAHKIFDLFGFGNMCIDVWPLFDPQKLEGREGNGQESVESMESEVISPWRRVVVASLTHSQRVKGCFNRIVVLIVPAP